MMALKRGFYRLHSFFLPFWMHLQPLPSWTCCWSGFCSWRWRVSRCTASPASRCRSSAGSPAPSSRFNISTTTYTQVINHQSNISSIAYLLCSFSLCLSLSFMLASIFLRSAAISFCCFWMSFASAATIFLCLACRFLSRSSSSICWAFTCTWCASAYSFWRANYC